MNGAFRFFWLILLLWLSIACNGNDDEEAQTLTDGDGETVIYYPDGDAADDADGDGNVTDDDDDTPTDGDSWPDGDEDETDSPGEQDEEESGCIQDPDGDETDGDETDGDEPDGDMTDGDEADGGSDETDGDMTDGDEPDGDESDGDIDETEGDMADGDSDDEEAPDACPTEMVAVSETLCMDRYEASRPDATAQSGGTTTSHATSRAGVLPWYPVTLATARSACQNAGKRLCTMTEWVDTCHGPDDTVYNYGNDYNPTRCNGIDAFCYCGEGSACAEVEVCPYPLCYFACGANFHTVPTGSFPDCVSPEGLWDLHGNVWELVEAGDNQEHYRGGAYNCSNSEVLHKCDYDGQSISAKGFRCCKDLP